MLDAPRAVIIDSKGRAVSAGYSAKSGGGNALALWRYLPSGIPDTTFGSLGTGVVTLTTGAAGASGASQDDNGIDVKLDSSNRILVFGSSKNASGAYQLAIWRFTADGVVDTAFGNGTGVLLSSATTGIAGATGASIYEQAGQFLLDGDRFILTGISKNSTGSKVFFLQAWKSDGTIDTTFASGGYISTGFGGATGVTQAEAVTGFAKDSKGRWIATGETVSSFFGRQVYVLRFSAVGALDTTFGNQGIFRSSNIGLAGGAYSSQGDRPESLAIDSSDRVVVSGKSKDPSGKTRAFVMRLDTASGALDPTFGNSRGFWITPDTTLAAGTGVNLYEDFTAITIDSKKRYVLASQSQTTSGGQPVYVSRMHSTGEWDSSFGSSSTGSLTFSTSGTAGATGASIYDYSAKIIEDSYGRYFLNGISKNSTSGYEATWWRYRSDGSLDK